MLTEQAVRPQTSHGGTDEDDIVFHYVDKNKMVESAVMGGEVIALCGYRFQVTRQPKPGSPVCPTCKELLATLRDVG